MSEEGSSARILGVVGDTRLAARHRTDGLGQDILVEATPLGERLAQLLAAMDGRADPEPDRVDEQPALAVLHTPRLDDHLLQLIDLLIDLRWTHPRLVQLTLDLGGDEAPA